MTPLERLARAHGIALSWWDIAGVDHRVRPETLEALLMAMGSDPSRPEAAPQAFHDNAAAAIVAEPGAAVAVSLGQVGDAYAVELENGDILEGRLRNAGPTLGLEQTLPIGLHRLRLDGDASLTLPVIVAPKSCLHPEDLEIDRGYGIAIQLYGLRTARASAIGDFEDLRLAVGRFTETGADFLGLNPLHALFPAEPGMCSPYSPSNRRYLNPVYLPLETERPGGALIDYPAVLAEKLRHYSWRFANLSPTYRRDLEIYLAVGGENLRNHCLFEVLQATMLAEGPENFDFRNWPGELQVPGTDAVEAFARENAAAVGFHAYLQMLAERELQATQAQARNAGMRLGLYRDLAVGVHPAGSMVWSTPGLTLRGISIGAPPDPFSPSGQNWNLAPFSPTALAAQGFRPLYDDLAANARHAGALRIDHVIGFERQFWIPEGMEPGDGAYVAFPFDAMARLASLVSHRHRCLIIGEDLGTVPEGFRPKMEAAGMLSCRVLWFEEEGNRTTPPAKFPRNALASISTHDLPTVRGFVEGRDIEAREALGLFPDADAPARARQAREREKARIRRSLEAEGLDASEPVEALSRYLARSKSALAIFQLEDLAGEIEQANLPGTIDEHPNWRRRLPKTIEELMDDPTVRRMLQSILKERRT